MTTKRIRALFLIVLSALIVLAVLLIWGPVELVMNFLIGGIRASAAWGRQCLSALSKFCVEARATYADSGVD